MKTLVLGATGTVGSRVALRLVDSGARPSVFVRNAERARALFGDRVDIHVGDLDEPRRSLAAAMAGVDAVFLVTDGPELAERDRSVALAARRAGVRHVVKLSTLDVRTGVGTGTWHARGEQAVRESGVAFTFIQPAVPWRLTTSRTAWNTSSTVCRERSCFGSRRGRLRSTVMLPRRKRWPGWAPHENDTNLHAAGQ